MVKMALKMVENHENYTKNFNFLPKEKDDKITQLSTKHKGRTMCKAETHTNMTM